MGSIDLAYHSFDLGFAESEYTSLRRWHSATVPRASQSVQCFDVNYDYVTVSLDGLAGGGPAPKDDSTESHSRWWLSRHSDPPQPCFVLFRAKALELKARLTKRALCDTTATNQHSFSSSPSRLRLRPVRMTPRRPRNNGSQCGSPTICKETSPLLRLRTFA